MNMLLALAWLMENSSSMRGMSGEKIVLALKFRNQMNQRKKRKKKARPLMF